MATNAEIKNGLLNGMREIESITSMLSKLKSDLKTKKELLKRMEDALSKSEERLQRKVSEIDEKDRRLSDIENKLLKRQEELQIQERDVQTNAILQFLSFQTREMEIQKRMEKVPDPEKLDEYQNHLKELKNKLEEKDIEIADLQAKISSAPVKGYEKGTADKEEITRLKTNLEEMKERLEKKEKELLKKEDDLHSKEQGMQKSMDDIDKKALDALEEREKQLKDMESKLKDRQKEISEFVNGIEKKDSKINELENELKLKDELLKMREQEGKNLSSADSTNVDKVRETIEKEYDTRINIIESNYKDKLSQMKKKIEILKSRNEELEVMGDQLSSEKLRVTLMERELKERMNEISFAEERLARRQELMLKERKQVDQQMKKYQEMKDGSQVTELNEELANRNKQLKEIEGKLREKEEYLRRKEREMREMESKMVDEEIMMETQISDDKDLERVRSGIRRFDDLCYGGFPFSSNFILYGPAYSGRRTFNNLFVVEGLKKGIPAIMVTTQHTPSELKDQMRMIIPKVDVYEEKGLLKFIDLYSKSMGMEEDHPNTIYIEKPTDLEAIENAIGEFQKEFKEKKYPYHKMVFNSLSTLLTYIEPLSIFRFFQVLNAKNKKNGATAIYVVDTGMHDTSVIQTLKHVMTGFIEFRLEDLKYYLRIEGGGDVMSRAWIEYSFTDKTFDLRGSFSLDHIR